MTTPYLNVAGMGVACGCGEISTLATGTPVTLPHSPVDLSPLAALLPGVSLRRVPRYARVALLACLRAGATREGLPEAIRQGIVVGTAHGGATMSCDFMDSILDSGPQLSSPTAFSHAVNNMGAGLLSLLLGLRGPCNTLMMGALSFAAMLDTASLLLYAGRADVVWGCVVDECDQRLTDTAPELPVGTEGAVCLELRRWEGTGRYVTVPTWSRGEPDYRKALPLQPALEVTMALQQASEIPVCCCMQTAFSSLRCTVTVGSAYEPPAIKS